MRQTQRLSRKQPRARASSKSMNNMKRSKRSKIVRGTPGEIKALSRKGHVVMFSTTTCPYCVKAKKFFIEKLNIYPSVHYLDKIADAKVRARAIKSLQDMTQHKTVPNVFVFQKHVGGFDDCQAAFKHNKFKALLQQYNGLLRYDGSWQMTR